MASANLLYPSAIQSRVVRLRAAAFSRRIGAIRAAAGAAAPRSRLAPTAESLEDRRLLSVSLISVSTDNITPGNGPSGESSVSQNGRYVAFSSSANNLVAGDTNGKMDVFLRDRTMNTTTLISRNPTDQSIGNDDSFAPVISADGRYVAFATRAGNLLTGIADTAGTASKVLRYDIGGNALELASAKPDGGLPGGNAGEPSISADGRFIAFTSFAETYGVSDSNRTNDVYVRDMSSHSVVLASVRVGTNSGGTASAANSMPSFDPSISADGNFVVFRSDASNLVANDTNDMRDTFIRGLAPGGTTRLVSVNTAGVSGNASSDALAVSGDGGVVAFQSNASDLVTSPPDTNNNSDVFLRNLAANPSTTTLLTVNRQGTASARGRSRFLSLSGDGRFATFSSTAPDLVQGDGNMHEDVFLKDLQTGVITALSVNPAGAVANGNSNDTYISLNGGFIAFTSDASDLVSGDNNNKNDIFLATAPDFSTDSTPPTVTLSASQPGTSAGNTEILFNLDLADETGLNTVTLGNVTVDRAGGGSFTAVPKTVVGSGTTATVTYAITISAAEGASTADNGTYAVTLPAGAVTDAKGNAAAGITGNNTFTVSVGDANGPDLVPTVTSKLPAAILGGSKKGRAKVRIANSGQQALIKAPVTVNLFLSDDQALGGDTMIGSITKTFTIKVGKAKNVGFKFTYPTSIGDGGFFVLAQVDPNNTIPEANERNNTAASAAPVNVVQPFIDLQPTALRNPTGTLQAGGTAFAFVTIKNNGNVPLQKKAVTVVLAASTDAASDPSDRVLATFNKTMTLGPGKTSTLKIKFAFPADLAANSYFITAEVDPANAIVETDNGNNTLVGTSMFVVS